MSKNKKDPRYYMNKKQLKMYYQTLVPIIKAIAMEYGYAVAIHGSMTRDLDIMAMPWVKNAKAPESLAIAIMKKVLVFENGLSGHSYTRKYWKENRDSGKPHGRLTYAIPAKQNAYIDLSVMPRKKGL